MIMALGWILHIRICNQEIGVGDRYGAAPHLMAEGDTEMRAGEGVTRSIRKRLAHTDITFNLLMHLHKDLGLSVCWLLRGRNRSFLHVSTPVCPGPFQQRLRHNERRESKSAYRHLSEETVFAVTL